MTAFFPFTPNNQGAFTFSPTLDGQPYNAVITFNLWGQRYYLNLYASSGPLVVAEAIVGSVDPVAGPLTTSAGLYTAAVVLPAPPAFVAPGWSVLSTSVPAGTTLTAVAPGGTVRLSNPALVNGVDQNATYDFVEDLIAGYNFTSSLVFRASSKTFEVSP